MPWFADQPLGFNFACELKLSPFRSLPRAGTRKSRFSIPLAPYHAIQVTVLLLSVLVDIQSQLHGVREETGISELLIQREPLMHLVLLKCEMHIRKARHCSPSSDVHGLALWRSKILIALSGC